MKLPPKIGNILIDHEYDIKIGNIDKDRILITCNKEDILQVYYFTKDEIDGSEIYSVKELKFKSCPKFKYCSVLEGLKPNTKYNIMVQSNGVTIMNWTPITSE